MDYFKGEIKLNKIAPDFKIKWVVFGTHKHEDKRETEKINIEIHHNNKKIDYVFYNSVMEKEISDIINRVPLAKQKGFIQAREIIRGSACNMWGGYDKGLNDKKISNYKEFNKKRIWWLIYGVLCDFVLNMEEVGSFKDFCDCFGYDFDSRKAEETYAKVLEMNVLIKSLFLPEESIKYFNEEIKEETEAFGEYIKLQIQEQY